MAFNSAPFIVVVVPYPMECNLGQPPSPVDYVSIYRHCNNPEAIDLITYWESQLPFPPSLPPFEDLRRGDVSDLDGVIG